MDKESKPMKFFGYNNSPCFYSERKQRSANSWRMGLGINSTGLGMQEKEPDLGRTIMSLDLNTLNLNNLDIPVKSLINSR